MRSYCVSFTVLLLYISCSDARIYFLEQFKDGDAWKDRWVQSEYRDDYGKFNLSHGHFYNDPVEDLGLTTSEDMRFYAVSAKFPEFSNKDKQLIIQYAVKRNFSKDFDCGGLYVKLLKSDIDQKKFHGDTTYQIMFGPDKCGEESRIHAILRYKGFYQNCRETLPFTHDLLSHVYTLIIYPNNSIEILADNERLISGDLEDYYASLPPRKIDDLTALKPSDWVDDAFIDDPEDKKPDDWDKPKYILDEDAKKPDDWDDDMDGEWEPPMKENPEYKGEWTPKRIENPAYKGEWEPPQIDNPEYKPDPNLYVYQLGAVGIDLWQVNCGTTFDNIIITDSREEAEKFADLTLKVARKGEEKMQRAYDEEKKMLEEKKRKEMDEAKEHEEEKEKKEEKAEETSTSQEEQEKKKEEKEKKEKLTKEEL